MKIQILGGSLLLLASACGSSLPVRQTSRPQAEASTPVGAPTSVDVNLADVREAALFAVETIQSRSNSLTPYHLTRVVKAERQVVAGLIYTLVIDVAHGEYSELHDVTVFQPPGTGPKELTADKIRLTLKRI